MRSYISNTPEEQKEMLHVIGLETLDDLFASIPEEVRFKKKLSIPDGISEMETLKRVKSLAGINKNVEELVCFLGAGAYDHFIPAAIDHLLMREEFYTAYTPYQPEISQGTLQAIFEYQTMVCSLTGLDVSNASLYDGASALAEAMMLACKETGRREILVARSLHPQGREVLRTYARFQEIKITEFGFREGTTDLEDLNGKLSHNTAAVIVQNPNFFGVIEDLAEIEKITHKNNALFIVSCDPISLAILKSPGELGADIAVGEGQSLGSPMSFGGPGLGFFAAKEPLLRRIPGRIVGMTTDKNGKPGFVLTLQAREQHIRREKATSNICSNEALCALTATIYLASLGKRGLREVALQCASKAQYTCDRLTAGGVFQRAYRAPFFKEFTVRYPGSLAELNEYLLKENILGGLDAERLDPQLRGHWIVAVTEKRTRAEIDDFTTKAVSFHA
jgi:glycine dehydrogenase subunit 1